MVLEAVLSPVAESLKFEYKVNVYWNMGTSDVPEHHLFPDLGSRSCIGSGVHDQIMQLIL